GLPSFANGRAGIDVHGNWIDAPRVAFYGVGNASRPQDKVSFLYRPTTVGVSLRLQALPLFAIGGGVDSLDIHTARGARGRPIEQLFTPADTAGLGVDPSYLRSRLFGQFAAPAAPGYSRRRGRARMQP